MSDEPRRRSSFIIHHSSLLRPPPPPHTDRNRSRSRNTRRRRPRPGSGCNSVCSSARRGVAESPRPWSRSEFLHALVCPTVRCRGVLQRFLQLGGVEAILVHLP